MCGAANRILKPSPPTVPPALLPTCMEVIRFTLGHAPLVFDYQ